MGVVVLVSLLSAVSFGLASALQHDGAQQARRRSPLHPGLVAELARRPGWQLGVVAQLTGVALHLCALNLGPLSLVQPLLAAGLVVALVAQRLSGGGVSQRALFDAGLVVVGLAIFLTLQPDRRPEPLDHVQHWPPGLCAAGALLAAALVVGLRSRDRVRGICLGAAAGTLMSVSAAMGKAWGVVLRTDGLPTLLVGWQLWAAVACGVAGALVSQAAFQAGPLGGSLAAMMSIDPVVGVGLGIVVFGEPFATEAGVGPRCLGLLITLVGVVSLARGQQADARRSRRRLPSLAVDTGA